MVGMGVKLLGGIPQTRNFSFTTSRGLVKVKVTGAVREPGWYGFPERSLVIEAVRKAGGALPQADLSEVDLGSRLKDEDEIWIPGEKIDINQASPYQISSLPGIGEILAQIIVEYRKKNGPFEDLSQLLRIPGIGKVKLEKIKGKINLGRGEPGG